jgi:hypothetical protein
LNPVEIALLAGGRSIRDDFLALGIICIVVAVVSAASWFQTRRRMAAWDIIPLDYGAWSNVKRAYETSAQRKWTLYFFGGMAVIGVVLLLIAGVMSI